MMSSLTGLHAFAVETRHAASLITATAGTGFAPALNENDTRAGASPAPTPRQTLTE
ncbi:MAG: hypothetical protein LBR08_10625 [Bacteroidales bacterium]|nr:hypothetical protein [Bacteroidales bacterium]